MTLNPYLACMFAFVFGIMFALSSLVVLFGEALLPAL